MFEYNYSGLPWQIVFGVDALDLNRVLMEDQGWYPVTLGDGSKGATYVKRFAVTAVTRDREYDLTAGNKSSKVWYFSANPNGEAEVVTVNLRQVGSVKKLKWDLDFAEVLIKGRASKGNIVSKNTLKRIELKEKGVSTLKPRKIWFDDTVQRLNVDDRGELIGEFRGEDRLLIIKQSGILKTIIPEMTTHFDDDMIVLEKWIPKKPISAIYYDGDKERYFVKRFVIESEGKEEIFITEHKDSQLEIVSTDWKPMAEVAFAKERGKDRRDNVEVNLEEFIAVKGITALGNQLTKEKVNQINLLDPLPYEAPEEIHADELEVIDEETITPETAATKESKPVKEELSKTPEQPKDNDSDDLEIDDEGQITLF